MKLIKMFMLGCVFTLGVLAAHSENLDTKVVSEVDIEALLSRIAHKIVKDNSQVAKRIEKEVAIYEKILLKDMKETGLPAPRSKSTKLAVVAGRMTMLEGVSQKTTDTDEDIAKLLSILEQSYAFERGTLGSPNSALVHGAICKQLKRYADSLIWLDRATEGLKESQLLKSIQKTKETVFRVGRDSLKFTGSIAGVFRGTKGFQYVFELYDQEDSSAPVFQGYQVNVYDNRYTITNVRPGKYGLIIYEKKDVGEPPRQSYWKVTVEEGTAATLNIALAPRFRPLAPESNAQVLLKDGGVLVFKWEKPALATNCVYSLNVYIPNSTNPPPKGMKGTMLVRKVSEPSAEIPVSEFREKGEYVWSVTLMDAKDKYKPVEPLTCSDSRKFTVK